jgi:hypothetical protein
MARKDLDRKKVSHKLTFDMQRRIAKFRLRNMNMPVSAIAVRFHCTPTQVNYAVSKYNKGELKEMSVQHSRKETTRLKKIKEEIAFGETDANKLFEDQRLLALQQLHATDNKMSAIERIDALTKLQKLSIQNHLRGVDADFMLFFVQYFRPGISENESIVLLNEVREIWKSTQR